MLEKIKIKKEEISLLIKSVPPVILILFMLTVFSMNLLANKSVDLPFSFIVLDSGMLISWFAFLTMDIITNRFGPKAATEISIIAILINLCMCLVFFLISLVPGTWGASLSDGFNKEVNDALNLTFGGSWYVIFGSAASFVVSALVNNFINHAVGKKLSKDKKGFFAFFTRTYISSTFGQLCDNLVFALLVSRVFFGWDIKKCIICALWGVVIEVVTELIFSKLGYKILKKWEKEGVGAEYLDKTKPTL